MGEKYTVFTLRCGHRHRLLGLPHEKPDFTMGHEADAVARELNTLAAENAALKEAARWRDAKKEPPEGSEYVQACLANGPCHTRLYVKDQPKQWRDTDYEVVNVPDYWRPIVTPITPPEQSVGEED